MALHLYKDRGPFLSFCLTLVLEFREEMFFVKFDEESPDTGVLER